jgi:hypothetical protein
VYGVTAVEWVKYMDNDPIEDHPATPPNGGKRMFPDKVTHIDAFPERRPVVRVKACITPPMANKYVYFKSFDVDDPSSNTAPIDPLGAVGGDNHAGVGTLSPTGIETDSYGYATVDFTVSMYPGDNYRVAASLSSSAISEPYLTQAMADAGSPPLGVKFSPMLTVWRRLHVEFDTMSAPPSTQPFGTVVATASRILPSGLVVNTTWGDASLSGGVLDPAGTAPANTVSYWTRTTFEVNYNIDSIVNIYTNEYTTDKFDNDGVNGVDDPGEAVDMSAYAADPANVQIGINTDDPLWLTDINPPNWNDVASGMNAYYNDAYIQVVAHIDGWFPFVRNSNSQLAHVDILGDSAFWCVCLGWGYEAGPLKDNQCPPTCNHKFYFGDDDPEDEGVPPHHMASILGIASGHPGETCMVFVETIRDRGGNLVRTASHEVGHCLGLLHSPYDPATGFEASRDGIMSWDDANHYYPCMKEFMDLVRGHTSPGRFSDYHIRQLRDSATD